MKIKLSQIKEGSVLELLHQYSSKEAEWNFQDQTFLKPVIFEAVASKQSDCLFIEGTLSSQVSRECSRCLVSIEESFLEKVRLTLSVKGKEVVDITEDLHDILVFQHPMKFLCQDACRGICAQCGVNRNSTACQCESDFEEEAGNAFSQLKKMV